jgi:hypothetical protein
MKHKWAITPLGRQRYQITSALGGPIEIYRVVRNQNDSPSWRIVAPECFTPWDNSTSYLVDPISDLEKKL